MSLSTNLGRAQSSSRRDMADAGPSGPSDEALLARFVQGDAKAFTELYQRYREPVRRALLSTVKSPALAEDLTQVTFAAVVKSANRFIPGTSVRKWLFAIARNSAVDQLRRGKLEQPANEAELTSLPAAAWTPKDARLERAVRRAVELLPPSLRDVVSMHRFEHLAFAEIARALGISEAAAKVRAHRGYERLRVLLQPEWSEKPSPRARRPTEALFPAVAEDRSRRRR